MTTHTTQPRRRAEELIAAARRAQAAREGAAVKVRLPAALAARGRACAETLGDTFADWVLLACRRFDGAVDGVANSENAPLATREGSECHTVKAPSGFTSAQIRAAIAAAAEHCEARTPPFAPDPSWPKKWIEIRL